MFLCLGECTWDGFLTEISSRKSAAKSPGKTHNKSCGFWCRFCCRFSALLPQCAKGSSSHVTVHTWKVFIERPEAVRKGCLFPPPPGLGVTADRLFTHRKRLCVEPKRSGGQRDLAFSGQSLKIRPFVPAS